MNAPGAAAPGAGFVAEALSPDFGFYLRAGRLLAERQSPLQHIEVLDTPLWSPERLSDDARKVLGW